MSPDTIVLDTNIISETIKEQPSDQVIAWLLQHEASLYLTAITVSELIDGARRLPIGKRRENLLLAIEYIIGGYQRRILPFDISAARVYAQLQTKARASGHQLTVEDGMIAAICVANNATLATRNTKDFAFLEIKLANPFEDLTPDVVVINGG